MDGEMQSFSHFNYHQVYYLKTGIPGRCNDAGAFSQTSLYRKLENNEVLPKKTRKMADFDVQYHLLGDSAFALKPWLIKTYRFVENLKYNI